MSAIITPAILDTVLGRLAPLFLTGANGDLATARHAASRMLAGYAAETEDELRLAAEIVSFSFHALEALAQAATPDMALTKVIRLRGGAVSLSREAHKSQRKLDQLQRDRRAGHAPQPAEPGTVQPEPTPPRPQIDKAITLIEATRDTIAAAGNTGGIAWTQADHKRQLAQRIAQNVKQNQQRFAAANPPT